MIFSDEFISSIADNPSGAVVKIVDTIEEQFNGDDRSWSKEEHSAIFEGFALLQSVVATFDLPQLGAFPKLTGKLAEDASAMWKTLRDYRERYLEEVTEFRSQGLINQFNARLGSKFSYEFSKGDLSRVQQLINELREKLGECKDLEQEHKQRLLQRLEKLQAELHKRMSDLDRFWGLVGDAGVILGKLGKDAKPFVDRIKEIADIVWRTQSRREELPSNAPTPLGHSDDNA